MEGNEGFKTHNNYSSQTLKRIMGKGFKTHKHATELSGRNKTNVVESLSSSAS